MGMSRRGFVMGMPLVLAGCGTGELSGSLAFEPTDSNHLRIYAAIDTEPFPVPAIDLRRVKPQFLRREVAYRTDEQPSTIVVDPAARYAYLVLPKGRAMRYGVGVG